MSVTSFGYALFLPLVALLYWSLPQRLRLPLLLLASYVYYAAWKPWAVLLLAGATLGNYGLARWLEASGRRRGILALGVAANLAVLATFKYALLFANTANQVLSRFGAPVSTAWAENLLLPLGLSFLTFEMIGYLVDVYRGRAAERSLFNLALYAAFFPSRASGPLRRVDQFLPQVRSAPTWDTSRALHGLALIARGAFKKLVLADSLAVFSSAAFGAAASAGVIDGWLGVLAFSLQIYCDFSGYTDIARGSGWLLGIALPENFRAPYTAQSVTEFWRRWHITLSNWLRDYLYIPLGGNRHGAWATYRNLLITMALGGLWHGASWTFALWGLYHGLWLAIERVWSRATGRNVLAPARRPALALLRMGWTMAVVGVGWVLFNAASLAQAGQMLATMFGLHGTLLGTALNETAMAETLAIALAYAGYRGLMLAAPQRPRLARYRSHWLTRSIEFAALIVAVVILRPAVSRAFIYFGF